MPPLHLLIALGPLSVYLLLIGRINFSRRSFLTTGTRDTLALALASAGLVVVGPMELFMPEAAAGFLGPWVWVPLLGLYSFCTLLIALLMKPRLVVYNITTDQLRPLVETVASQLDADRRWAGTSLLMPNVGVQLSLEAFSSMHNVQLIATGGAHQDLGGWRKLDVALREALKPVRVEPNPRGVSFLFFGVIMAAMVVYGLSQQPEQLTQAIRQFLRMP